MLSAGGTAGHILPALTTLAALRALTARQSLSVATSDPAGSRPANGQGAATIEALFVGGQEGMEAALVRRADVPFVAIPAGAVHGVGAVRMARGAWQTVRGVAEAWRLIGRWRPDAVLLTGGFVGVPVSVAAWLRGVPAVVFLPDIEPGLALNVMARLAWRVAATTGESARYIPSGKLVATGYPLREAFLMTDRPTARRRLQLPADERVILVYGGSKGARSINRAVAAALPALLDRATVFHVTGEGDWAEIEACRNAMSPDKQARYRATAYLHEEMADAMAAADLVICRSGASTLGELPALGVPAILSPYPHAWRYQKVNAAYLEDRGAAVLLEDGLLNDPTRGLAAQVSALLDDPERLARMRRAAATLGRRDGADNIAALVAQAAERSHG